MFLGFSRVLFFDFRLFLRIEVAFQHFCLQLDILVCILLHFGCLLSAFEQFTAEHHACFQGFFHVFERDLWWLELPLTRLQIRLEQVQVSSQSHLNLELVPHFFHEFRPSSQLISRPLRLHHRCLFLAHLILYVD